MGRLIVPQRGQPLDVSYIYDIVSAVNELADRFTSSENGMFKIIAEDGLPSTVPTSRMSVFAKTHILSASKPVTTIGQTESFTITYNFKTTPIVVATPFDSANTSAGQDVAVVLAAVTNTNATFNVRYDTVGVTSTKINIIAIGIPN
jgi:hypothetical protein